MSTGSNIENMFYQELDNVREQVKGCAVTIWEHNLADSILKDYMKQLEGVLEECVKAEHSVALARTAARDAEVRAVDESTSIPRADLFDEVYEESLEELKADSQVIEALNNAPSIKEFKRLIQEQSQPVTTNGTNGVAEDHDDSEELVETQQTISLIDPISKTVMTDPVRHKHCKHVYDRSSVVSMINASGRKGFRCPNMGCSYRKALKIKDLEEAKDIKLEIRRQKIASKPPPQMITAN